MSHLQKTENEASAHQVLQRSPHAIAITTGPDHTVRAVNPAFESLVGTYRDEAVGLPLGELLGTRAPRNPLTLLNLVYETGEAAADRKLRDPDHVDERVWNCTAWPILEDGTITGLWVELTDRTADARSRSEVEGLTEEIRTINERLLIAALQEQEWAERAESANRAKTDFLSMLSHELRTPLTGIVGYTELLESEVVGPLTERQRGSVERVKLCADLLLRQIDDLLTFSRIEAGHVHIRREAVDVLEVVRAAVAIVEPLARQKGLSLQIDDCDEPATADTDCDKVRQIVLNLLANAVKFTDRGAVTLKVLTDTDNVLINVCDTGIGINNRDLERVFEPFMQAEEITTRRFGGAGLGLAISRSLAAALGGGIQVQSSPGTGSTFCLFLPRSRR